MNVFTLSIYQLNSNFTLWCSTYICPRALLAFLSWSQKFFGSVPCTFVVWSQGLCALLKKPERRRFWWPVQGYRLEHPPMGKNKIRNQVCVTAKQTRTALHSQFCSAPVRTLPLGLWLEAGEAVLLGWSGSRLNALSTLDLLWNPLYKQVSSLPQWIHPSPDHS